MDRQRIWCFLGDSTASVAFHLGAMVQMLRDHPLDKIVEMHFEGANILLFVGLLVHWQTIMLLRDQPEALAQKLQTALVEPILYILSGKRKAWNGRLDLLQHNESEHHCLPEGIAVYAYSTKHKDAKHSVWRFDVLDALRKDLTLHRIVRLACHNEFTAIVKHTKIDYMSDLCLLNILQDHSDHNPTAELWISQATSPQVMHQVFRSTERLSKNNLCVKITMMRLEVDDRDYDTIVSPREATATNPHDETKELCELYASFHNNKPLSVAFTKVAEAWGEQTAITKLQPYRDQQHRLVCLSPRGRPNFLNGDAQEHVDLFSPRIHRMPETKTNELENSITRAPVPEVKEKTFCAALLDRLRGASQIDSLGRTGQSIPPGPTIRLPSLTNDSPHAQLHRMFSAKRIWSLQNEVDRMKLSNIQQKY